MDYREEGMDLLLTKGLGAAKVHVRHLHTLIIDWEQGEFCVDRIKAPRD